MASILPQLALFFLYAKASFGSIDAPAIGRDVAMLRPGAVVSPFKPAAWVPLASVAAFIASLALPAVLHFRGWFFLTSGPFAVLGGHVGWLATPSYCVAFGFLLHGNPGRAFKWAAAALALALTSLVSVSLTGIAQLSGATEVAPSDFGPGFYLWLLAIALVLGESWRLKTAVA